MWTFGSVKVERDEHYTFRLVWTDIFVALFGCAKMSIREDTTLIVNYCISFLCTLSYIYYCCYLLSLYDFEL